MRLFPAASFLAVPALAALTLLTALGAPLSPRAALAAMPEPAAAVDAPPPALAAPGDADAPPPFVSRPKRPPQPPRPDLTFASRPAPASFRSLAWGAPLEQAREALGLQPVTNPRPLANTFQRPGELLKLGQADIRTVAYYFPKGRFTGVGIMFEGEANFFLIKDHLIEQFGPGRQAGDRYGWTWPHFNIDLRLRDGAGELRYTFEP